MVFRILFNAFPFSKDLGAGPNLYLISFDLSLQWGIGSVSAKTQDWGPVLSHRAGRYQEPTVLRELVIWLPNVVEIDFKVRVMK